VSARPVDALLKIELLNDQHDRASFRCGVWALDQYLQKQAGQERRKDVAAVFVATQDGTAIAGYYTLSTHTVKPDELPPAAQKKMPKYEHLPTTLLGRLAVASAFQGQGIGELLLMHALSTVAEVTERMATTAVVVDAKDEAAKAFYMKYEFIPFPLNPMRLYLSTKTIRRLIG
jgi:GNAT superfamily N-acetyltransferase